MSQIFDCLLCFSNVFHQLHTSVSFIFFYFPYFKHYGVLYTILTKLQHWFINLLLKTIKPFLYSGIQLYCFTANIIKRVWSNIFTKKMYRYQKGDVLIWKYTQNQPPSCGYYPMHPNLNHPCQKKNHKSTQFYQMVPWKKPSPSYINPWEFQQQEHF